MALEHCELAQKVAPSAASVSSNLTGNADATQWHPGPWVELIASAAADLAVTGIVYVEERHTEVEYDIGVGAAGSETVKGTLRLNDKALGTNTQGWLGLPVPGAWIAAGNRVAMRIKARSFSSASTEFGAGITYVTGAAAVATMTTTTKPSKTIPAAANGKTMTPAGTSWANSAWVELTAATTAAWVLHGLVLKNPSNVEAGSQEWDVGVGAAGSEAVVTTARIRGGNDGMPSIALFPVAFDGIASGVRVAIRMRQTSTNVSTWTVAAVYMEAPL